MRLEKVVIQILNEKENLRLFKRKQLDALLQPLYKSETIALLKDPSIQQWEGIIHTRYLCFNCLDPIFQNRKLRQALSLAINRDELAFQFYKGAFPYYSMYSPYFTQLKVDKQQEENPLLAKQLFSEALQEMGIKREEIYNQKIYISQRYKQLAQFISQQLYKVLNLHWELVVMESAKILSLIAEKKTSISIYSWMDQIRDPSYFLEIFSSSHNIVNRSFWTSSEMQCLIRHIQNSSCSEKRQELHAEAERLLQLEKPMVPLLYTPTYSQTHSNIQSILNGPSKGLDICHCYKT